MRKLKILGATVLVGIIAAVAISALIPNPFYDEVQALLDDTGATYEIRDCSGGWASRTMHSEISISRSELAALGRTWELDADLPDFEGDTRLILVPDDKNPCSSGLRAKYSSSFGIQQWTQSRHGFASVVVFYNQKTERACLFLSIAYG
jgi:hypothetical protein